MALDIRILLACVCYAGYGGASRADDILPCSQRYPHAVTYPLFNSDVGKNPEPVLESWGVETSRWGWERIRIVQHDDSSQPALEFFYPRGSINPSNDAAPQGGASLYINGGFQPPVKSACLHYRVYFPEGFAFGKGGKLPGLYGGRNSKGESAAGCRKGIVEDAFSTRYMWRENGAGSLYAYFPGKEAVCGEYIGKGSWYFRPGQWTVLEQEVVLNDPAASNGIVRVWANGDLVIDQPNIVLRTKENISIDGIFFVSFFGGKEAAWASPADQRVTFSDVKVFFAAR
jgi:hypothetical protein